jgi:hypothetical protein
MCEGVHISRNGDLDTADEDEEGYIAPSVQPIRLPVVSPEMVIGFENIGLRFPALPFLRTLPFCHAT